MAAALILLFAVSAAAQRFSVESFRLLPNDVSAFIEPVKDLNGDDCALLKVEAPADFVFSTPLGIVRRIDNVGEIWLYVPKGTKRLTLKHPRWGVLRNYAFPEAADSHMTYEVRLILPETAQAEPALRTDTVYTMLRDTLVVVRTDTLRLPDVPRFRPPLTLRVVPTLGVGGCAGSVAVTGGLRVMLVKRHGGYLHASTDFGRIGKTVGECGRDGSMDGRVPFYSGKTRHSCLMATAGAAHQISPRFGVFEGLGYGWDRTAWELAPSEGGGFVSNSGLSTRGVVAEAGGMFSWRRLTATASVATIGGRRWYGLVGVGVVF